MWKSIVFERTEQSISDIISFKVNQRMLDSFECDTELVSKDIQVEIIKQNCNDECKNRFERSEMTKL